MSDDVATDTEADTDDQATTDRAREQGWRTKEELERLGGFDPKKWVDAKTYLERGEKSLPIVRDRNRKLEAEMKDLRQLVRDVLDNQKADRERAIGEAIEKLKAEKAVAIQDADAPKVNAIDAQMEKLREAPKKEARTETAEPISDVYLDWGKKNPWLNPKSKHYDPAMAALAVGYHDMLEANQEYADLDDAERLDMVNKEMRKRFPEKFENARRKEAPLVEGGNGSASRGNGTKKTYSDLPKEAQDMCDRLVRQKVITREKYLETYQWN